MLADLGFQPVNVMCAVQTSRAVLVGCLLTQAASCVQAQTDGIFAEFNTSMGSFTCRVDHAKAPKASASFIGLATGERAWLDLPTGSIKSEPFYDGQIFHRVIAGFMNQGGSPNGLGTDGPGYSFVDEFDPRLRHDGFGVLSMANSGPDSNGSQFFITTAATPWLDDAHTVFGRLEGGSNVVYAINHVVTDANNRPLTNVVLQSVVIRRVGAAAAAFDLHAQGLPIVDGLRSSIQNNGTNLILTFSNSLNRDNRLYSSTNLTAWVGSKLGIETAQPILGGLILNTLAPQRFYRMARVSYPDTLYVPKNVVNRAISLSFSAVFGNIAILPDNPGGGLYSQNGGPVGSIAYTWVQDAYRGRLSPILFTGVVPPMRLHLDFDSATNGTFNGTALTNYPSAVGLGVSGTFTASP